MNTKTISQQGTKMSGLLKGTFVGFLHYVQLPVNLEQGHCHSGPVFIFVLSHSDPSVNKPSQPCPPIFCVMSLSPFLSATHPPWFRRNKNREGHTLTHCKLTLSTCLLSAAGFACALRCSHSNS